MTVRDLVELFGLCKEKINYRAVTDDIGTLLEGEELTKFKNENPNINMKFVSVIRVFNRSDITKFVTSPRIPYDGKVISEYFDRSEINDY